MHFGKLYAAPERGDVWRDAWWVRRPLAGEEAAAKDLKVLVKKAQKPGALEKMKKEEGSTRVLVCLLVLALLYAASRYGNCVDKSDSLGAQVAALNKTTHEMAAHARNVSAKLEALNRTMGAKDRRLTETQLHDFFLAKDLAKDQRCSRYDGVCARSLAVEKARWAGARECAVCEVKAEDPYINAPLPRPWNKGLTWNVTNAPVEWTLPEVKFHAMMQDTHGTVVQLTKELKRKRDGNRKRLERLRDNVRRMHESGIEQRKKVEELRENLRELNEEEEVAKASWTILNLVPKLQYATRSWSCGLASILPPILRPTRCTLVYWVFRAADSWTKYEEGTQEKKRFWELLDKKDQKGKIKRRKDQKGNLTPEEETELKRLFGFERIEVWNPGTEFKIRRLETILKKVEPLLLASAREEAEVESILKAVEEEEKAMDEEEARLFREEEERSLAYSKLLRESRSSPSARRWAPRSSHS